MKAHILPAFILSLALVVGGPLVAASAHNAVIATTPRDGETLTATPETFSITTSDQMLDLGGNAAGFGMLVTNSDGKFFGDGCLAIDGPSLSMPATLGEAGDYTLTYQFVSADGHTGSGALPFTFDPAPDAVLYQGFTDAPLCGESIPQPIETATENSSPSPSETTATDSVEVTSEAALDDAADSFVNPAVWGALGAVAIALIVVFASVARSRRSTAADVVTSGTNTTGTTTGE